ncbi:tyrosine-type recombinase/integrase [Massilia haematophila]|uniref:Tyrosine-type recombinase/integrase n=1 Tax=Massilia haematophila TaxID=457923 RepID=A0ABV7PQF0_9BURK
MEIIVLLNMILAANAHTRVNGKVASERTVQAAGEALRAIFRLLVKLGYRLEDPKNINEKHIKALCGEWYRLNRSPKTIQGYLSHLRTFCGWIGKKGLVKDVYHYLPLVPKGELRVKTVAEKSKSWAEVGIDVGAKAAEAAALDWRFGLMIMAQVAFGLRRMEVLQLQPWKNDKGDKFAAYATKGGRPRDIEIDTPVQRAVLDLIKSKIGRKEYLGWPTKADGSAGSLKYSKRRYNYLMEKIGINKVMAEVTGHGLRAQFAENAALLKGLIPPTLGGTPGQMPRVDRDLIKLQVSENLGHSRESITGAYYGGFGRETTLDGPGRAKEMIEQCLATITADQLRPIADDRLAQCACLGAELMAIQVYDDPRKIQLLWEHYSRRHSVEWIPPVSGSNLAALEAAAISVLRAKG